MASIRRDRGPRSPVEDYDRAIERAAKVLKGSNTKMTPQNVSRRAMQYLRDVGYQTVLAHIRAFPPEKQAQLGITN